MITVSNLIKEETNNPNSDVLLVISLVGIAKKAWKDVYFNSRLIEFVDKAKKGYLKTHPNDKIEVIRKNIQVIQNPDVISIKIVILVKQHENLAQLTKIFEYFKTILGRSMFKSVTSANYEFKGA